MRSSSTIDVDRSIVSEDFCFCTFCSHKDFLGNRWRRVNLLQIPADRTQPNKFVLTAIDRVFSDKNELLQLDGRDIDTDNLIVLIRSKFLQSMIN